MSHSRTDSPRSCLILVLAAFAVFASVVVPAGSAPSASAQVASRTVAARKPAQIIQRTAKYKDGYKNPLANLRWGSYDGSNDELYNAWRAAKGGTRSLLARMAFQPRSRWFGGWYPNSSITNTIRKYIANTTHGRSNVLVQMAVFRVSPWEMHACHSLPTAEQQASYRQWITGFARGIGRAHVALILQPDLPFWFCVPHHSRIPLNMVNFAARTFSKLPNTATYIDAGAADWASTSRAVTLLRGAGIRYVHGFALNATHYDGTSNNLYHGASIVRALNRAGIRHKHFVINTAANGKPFTHWMYYKSGRPSFTNAEVCHSLRQHRCVSPGIPPTADVTNSRWRLSAGARSVARKYCDGFMWIGRPWLDNEAQPFDLVRTLALARNWAYAADA
jgi:endoglucanase